MGTLRDVYINGKTNNKQLAEVLTEYDSIIVKMKALECKIIPLINAMNYPNQRRIMHEFIDMITKPRQMYEANISALLKIPTCTTQTVLQSKLLEFEYTQDKQDALKREINERITSGSETPTHEIDSETPKWDKYLQGKREREAVGVNDAILRWEKYMQAKYESEGMPHAD